MTHRIVCDGCGEVIAFDGSPRFQVSRQGGVAVYAQTLDYDVCSPECLEALGYALAHGERS